MLTTRIIPVLLLRNGSLVKSRGFNFYQKVGNPYAQLERYNSWDLDELIYIDISPNPNQHSLHVLKKIAQQCFMPLTFGGNIRSLQDIEQRLNLGADKVTINAHALDNPEFITHAAKEFGQQAIVISIDVYRKPSGQYCVYSLKAKNEHEQCPFAWSKQVESLGAGELFIQSVEHDGFANGYNSELLKEIVSLTTIPVVAMSGAYSAASMRETIQSTGVSAVAAANIFLFTELSYLNIKQALIASDVYVRS